MIRNAATPDCCTFLPYTNITIQGEMGDNQCAMYDLQCTINNDEAAETNGHEPRANRLTLRQVGAIAQLPLSFR